MKAKLFNISLIVAVLLIAVVPVVGAAPPPPPVGGLLMFSSAVDDAPHPLGDAQRAARQEAFVAQAHGSANGQYL